LKGESEEDSLGPIDPHQKDLKGKKGAYMCEAGKAKKQKKRNRANKNKGKKDMCGF